MNEDRRYQEQESAETKRCRGIVITKEAELEQSKADHIEARKAQWNPIPISELHSISGKIGVFYCLTPNDWAKGQFEYAERVEPGCTKPSIGGYFDNDRFRGEVAVYVPTLVSGKI